MKTAAVVVDHGNQSAVIAANMSALRSRAAESRTTSGFAAMTEGFPNVMQYDEIPCTDAGTHDRARASLRSQQIFAGRTGSEEIAGLGLMTETFRKFDPLLSDLPTPFLLT
jgi:hypothetical protein